MSDKFSTTVIINSSPAVVWTVLINPELMSQWMGEPAMKLAIQTEWKINNPIFIRGTHHLEFENRGIVLHYEEAKKVSYSHLSSLSRLPDQPENYSILEFTLTPVDNRTVLNLDIRNFPTETIRKHLEFYWRAAIVAIKKRAEQ